MLPGAYASRTAGSGVHRVVPVFTPDHQTALLLFQTGKHEALAGVQTHSQKVLPPQCSSPVRVFVSDKGCCRNISKFSTAAARAAFDCGRPSFTANDHYFPSVQKPAVFGQGAVLPHAPCFRHQICTLSLASPDNRIHRTAGFHRLARRRGLRLQGPADWWLSEIFYTSSKQSSICPAPLTFHAAESAQGAPDKILKLPAQTVHNRSQGYPPRQRQLRYAQPDGLHAVEEKTSARQIAHRPASTFHPSKPAKPPRLMPHHGHAMNG